MDYFFLRINLKKKIKILFKKELIKNRVNLIKELEY